MSFLFTVNDVFSIKDRGVVVSGRPKDTSMVKIGMTVEARRDNGSTFQSGVSAGLWGLPGMTICDLLLPGIGESQVGIGDQVWLIVNPDPNEI